MFIIMAEASASIRVFLKFFSPVLRKIGLLFPSHWLLFHITIVKTMDRSVINRYWLASYYGPRPGGSAVGVLDSWPGGCEFDPRLRRLFFPAYFRLSPLQKHVRKVVGGFGKKSCVSTGVRKPGKHICATDRHDMTFAVKVALNPIQPTKVSYVYTRDMFNCLLHNPDF